MKCSLPFPPPSPFLSSFLVPMALPWKRLPLVLLWVQLSLPEGRNTPKYLHFLLMRGRGGVSEVTLSFLSPVAASCRILRCNSDFVAATLDLGSSPGAGGRAPLSREAVNAEYCRALHSYSTCTKRMARPCRGDLAYHSAVQGIEDLLIQYRCPLAGPTAQPRPLPQGRLSGDICLYDRRLAAAAAAAAEAQQPDYLHCGVFGDPHIRTFNNDFHTCAVQGAWPLIDNDFLYVQATSSPTRRGLQATMLTKVLAATADHQGALTRSNSDLTADLNPRQLWGQSIIGRSSSGVFRLSNATNLNVILSFRLPSSLRVGASVWTSSCIKRSWMTFPWRSLMARW